MRKKMDNKGFSLVELIIVIAIMAVLVGVLAPQFMKYVEQSRRATDIQNAEMIRDSILADIADGKLTGKVEKTAAVTFISIPSTGYVADGTMATAISKAPTVQGNLVTVSGGGKPPFKVAYDANEGTCNVMVGDYELTDATIAGRYKEGKSPSDT